MSIVIHMTLIQADSVSMLKFHYKVVFTILLFINKIELNICGKIG